MARYERQSQRPEVGEVTSGTKHQSDRAAGYGWSSGWSHDEGCNLLGAPNDFGRKSLASAQGASRQDTWMHSSAARPPQSAESATPDTVWSYCSANTPVPYWHPAIARFA